MLHNRITYRIYLRPFYLSECKAYLTEHGFEWDEYQILQCYMLFGGIPYYLSLLRPNLSLPENVDALVFRRGGDLANEFDKKCLPSSPQWDSRKEHIRPSFTAN